MKTQLKLLVKILTLCLVFVACSKNDDDDVLSNAAILGTWTTTDAPISGGGVLPDMELQVEWTFKSNNTATERSYVKLNNTITKDITVGFKYKYKGSTIILTSTESANATPFTYEISVTGNRMRLGNKTSGYFNLTKKQ